MSGWTLEVRSGGDPGPERLAALTAAITALIESEVAATGDDQPAAYRSRWRRAALMESSEVASLVKYDSPPWGVQ